ncbi:MAG: GlxA family transcriptional regulator [Pseudomonadota bacterium]
MTSNAAASQQQPKRLYFYLVPNFSMSAFTAAVEALRLTNRVLGREAYQWPIVSKSGRSEVGSNGVSINVDMDLDTARRLTADPAHASMVIVCSGISVEAFEDQQLFAWLRRINGQQGALGGICTGSWVLARSGVMEGRRCTIHWENLPGFQERFPDVDVRSCLFDMHENIATCAGGTAALDMMLHIIGRRHGEKVVSKICELSLIDRIRPAEDRQRLPIGVRIGVQNHHLLTIIELMEANIAEPLSLSEISDVTRISRRHVERLFRQHLGRSPARYYLDVRLERARRLLRHSNLPIVEVAIAAGFVSASHFSKRYRERYQVTPQADRREYEPTRTQQAIEPSDMVITEAALREESELIAAAQDEALRV